MTDKITFEEERAMLDKHGFDVDAFEYENEFSAKNLLEAMKEHASSERKRVCEEIAVLINNYWRFDNNQQPNSSWHEKQDLLEIVSNKKHVCGLQGFNMMLGDTCPACEERSKP